MIFRATLFLSLLALLVQGCRPSARFHEINGLTQGTTYHIVVSGPDDLNLPELREKIEGLLGDVDRSLSVYNDSSTISLVNSGRSDLSDSLFREVFRLSAGINRQSGGLFDITVGPLVRSWGFGPDAMKRFDESKLDSLMALVGMDKVRIEGDRVIRADSNMFIDVNAIAQGYTVDLIIALLRKNGFDDCLVEVGGEVGAAGNKDGNGWRIGIDRPSDGNYEPGADLKAIIRLDDMSLATSGNYRKFFIENGVKYSHTIDPRTGYPVRHTLLSATVVAPSCAVADAWATACMVGGRDSAIAFIDRYDFLEGYLIWSDENGAMKSWISEGLRKRIEENN